MPSAADAQIGAVREVLTQGPFTLSSTPGCQGERRSRKKCYIATDNTKALQDDPDRSKSILDRIPAGRWGVGSDLAGATVFLASRSSDYVSGAILNVDSGWLER
ncbi:SDR family oxidoreductase [Salinibacterium amurskyense]|uniref:SDR family oxidoreductase n=1 Tax=Salinibacterium amurskyense TaxID=205941 RepID=UPI0035711FF2